jgi:hypothetical protein
MYNMCKFATHKGYSNEQLRPNGNGEFIRGDLSPSEFKKWLYKSNNFESAVENELYLEAISTDFNDYQKVQILKEKLESFLRRKLSLNCECLILPNMVVIDEGSEHWQHVFETLNEIKRYGESRWWLSLNQCKYCSQYWLVAQESRINDIDLFKRIENSVADNIIHNDIWPKCFETFAKLLAIGKHNNRLARFDDPFAFSLVITIQDLKVENPDISMTEIAYLLNLDDSHVRELCKRQRNIFWRLKFWFKQLKLWA